MTDKQIIKKFSDNHCLVLENNQISLRENEFTAYRIVLGKSTNELLEFVKDTYLQLKRKEQECDMWKNLTVDNGAVALKYQQQLDQLKAELEVEKNWHKTADEISKANSEYTAKLEADNKHLNDLLNQALKVLEEVAQNKYYKYTMR